MVPVFDIGRTLIFGVKVLALIGLLMAVNYMVDHVILLIKDFFAPYLSVFVFPPDIKNFLALFVDPLIFTIFWLYIKLKLAIYFYKFYMIFQIRVVKMVN